MFWDMFYKLCHEKQMSPNAIAKEIGVSSGSITSWKKGKVPHHTTLIKIADYFGVSTDYLLRNQQQPPTPELNIPGDTPAMFYENFIRLCAEKNESPNFVAKQLNLSTGTVTWWKKGRIPHQPLLMKLADYFGVPVDYLLRNQQQPPAPEMDIPSDSPALLKSMEILKNLSEEEQELALSLLETVANRKNKPKS